MNPDRQDEIDEEDTVDLTKYRRTVNEGPRTAFTTGEVRAIINDDAPAPHGIDPETIAAARRIARRLNGI
jgi:hypothetical protein